jgi:hypothetical protein
MNPILANIYSTHGGLEKTAGLLPEGVDASELPANLSDLALLLVADESGDIQKTASEHKDVLGSLISFDEAGRYVAQAEFSEMEKAASEGDSSALEEFFSDVGQGQLDERAALKAALRDELRSRGL